jgi:hypothetical protein
VTLSGACRDLDEDLHRNLQWILANEVEALDLTFTWTRGGEGGAMEDVELVRGGKAMAVTDENKVLSRASQCVA